MKRIKHLGTKYVLNCVNNKMLESVRFDLSDFQGLVIGQVKWDSKQPMKFNRI